MKPKNLLTMTLAGVLTLSLVACGGNTASTPAPTAAPSATPAVESAAPSATPAPTQAPEDATFHMNFTLPVPEEYQDLLKIESVEPTDENRGLFLEVYEKASVEAGAKQHPGEDWGDGWLFSLGVMDEASLRELSCDDMSGVRPLGQMEDGSYMVYYHPTDVRIAREGDITEADTAQWTALNEWAATVPDTVIRESGVAPYTRTNTSLDMYLNRMMYRPETRYSFSSLEYGVELMPKESVDSAAYLEKLTDGLKVEWLEDGEFPDGQYTVLKFLEDDVWFAFADADGNMVKQVVGDYETVYRLTYENGTTVAGDVLREWCAALAGV